MKIPKELRELTETFSTNKSAQNGALLAAAIALTETLQEAESGKNVPDENGMVFSHKEIRL